MRTCTDDDGGSFAGWLPGTARGDRGLSGAGIMPVSASSAALGVIGTAASAVNRPRMTPPSKVNLGRPAGTSDGVIPRGILVGFPAGQREVSAARGATSSGSSRFPQLDALPVADFVGFAEHDNGQIRETMRYRRADRRR